MSSSCLPLNYKQILKNIAPVSLQKSSLFTESDKLPVPQTPLDEMLQAESEGTALRWHVTRQRGWRGEGVSGIICSPCLFPGWLVDPVRLTELMLWQEGKVHSH